MHSIFDPEVVDSATKMYQGWAAPDLFPDERQPRLENWHPEDLVATCGGGYAKIEYQNN